ncbi:exported hypothetical protein [Syntrophobacter sp. SbD1]|nr:exported hypothetical protein [Syntrophobacter sp. SbD1]
MVRKICVLISTCCLITALMLIARPPDSPARGGGCYVPKGPFQQLTGEFVYDYKLYGAVGKDWEGSCTRETTCALVNAHANPEGGRGGWPAVEFTVWFLGPMKSDNPKCTFEISNGGEVKAIKEATRHHLNVIAVPKVFDDAGTHDFSNLQSNTPWTIRFSCASE